MDEVDFIVSSQEEEQGFNLNNSRKQMLIAWQELGNCTFIELMRKSLLVMQ